MSKSLSIKVGMFVIIGFILLGAFSLMSEGFKKLKGTYHIKTHFKQVAGLNEGDYVLLAGVHIGYVDKIIISKEYKDVTLELRIFKDTQIAKDAKARLELISIMGLKSVNISMGDPTKGYIEPGGIIEGEETIELSQMIASVNDATSSAKSFVDSINKNQDEIATRIKGILDENRENIKKTVDSVAEAAPQFKDTVANINEAVSSITNGKGSIGKLFTDDTMYNDLKSFFDGTNDIIAQVKEGKGTIGRLIYDEKMYTNVYETFESVKNTSDSLNEMVSGNKEDVRNVVESFKKFSADLSKTAETFKEISENIKKGEGTIGKLVTDDTLYNDARKAIARIDESFAESQEQSVIKTFVGVFF